MDITIIGYGNQARAWAHNLRDSKVTVNIALRSGSSSIEQVKKDNFVYKILQKDELSSDAFIMLIPDHVHFDFLEKYHQLFLSNSVFIYAHGHSNYKFNLASKFSNFTHLLLAPKGIASELRRLYKIKGGLGAACSVEHSNSKKKHRELLQSIATKIGINVGPFETSFEDETKADLFSEQSILCSLIPFGAAKSFQKLREKGISKELAYLECWYELKLIIDTMVKVGPERFFDLISPNALIGANKAKSILFDKNMDQKMDQLLEDIWNNKFFDEIEQTDVNSVREEIKNLWKSDELNKTHEELGSKLFV